MNSRMFGANMDVVERWRILTIRIMVKNCEADASPAPPYFPVPPKMSQKGPPHWSLFVIIDLPRHFSLLL